MDAPHREDAWHQLGTALPSLLTAEEALKAAKLANWKIRKLPLSVQTEKGVSLPVDRFAVVRNNPGQRGQVDVIGECVGKNYRVWQNEELGTLLNAIVDESGGHFTTAGALDGGKRVFITMKVPANIKIGGVDPVDMYLALVTSHDGSMSHTLMVTPIRITSQAMLNCAFADHASMFRVRHTKGSDKIMLAEARRTLGLSFDYIEGFQAQAERMISATLTQQRFEQIILKEFGPGESAAAATITRTDKKLDEMATLFADASTQQGVRNTVWAGFSALTEWYDHYAPARGDDRDTTRAVKAILDPAFKDRALRVMMEQV